ncbi:ribonuclease H-like domain-containing protein [Tanacetum coccineum]|uniref:Ribonuclease H-like domain-containing protein n=1 Tax=Tanacetum coccineum TaxID=301880 RepID=A0ABQ5AMB0_9ASTR
MLANSKLPTTFWAEVVNTACYVQNRVLVTKPHNKTPYELFLSRKPSLSFIRPFRCPVTILNTIDHLGKFDGKADEGFFVGYSINRSRPNWLFDIDALTKSMNYKPVIVGNQSNGNAGTKACDDPADLLFSQSSKSSPDAGFKPSRDDEKKVTREPGKDDNVSNTNNVNTASDGNNTNNINVREQTTYLPENNQGIHRPGASVQHGKQRTDILLQMQREGGSTSNRGEEKNSIFGRNPCLSYTNLSDSLPPINASYHPMNWMPMTLISDETHTGQDCSHANLSWKWLNALTETETDITSDSNIIPYSQYLSETQQETVQNSNSSAQTRDVSDIVLD